ncbi:lysyl oxidase homolog 3A-like [Dendronephthya gigantea]|uniref:lysyl oxidase homolog 3A-like n=1 Tax=Dendronephthya gigantea TaxID=151771 RepID=UPI00106A3A2A|nr:lysyl oxidase homolog 3A-like [Dendronephthya gigantea]
MRMTVFLGFVALYALSLCEARVKLRLADGKHKYEGRVEAFVNRQWGPISAKDWDKKAAQVVCRQLGFGGEVIRYTKGVTYSHPKRVRTVWLEEINCEGTENHIDQCNHSGWAKPKRRLSFYNLAGVMCYTEEGRILLPPVDSAWGDIDVSKIKFWLEGKVENGIISAGYLRISYQTMQGYVCADNWQFHSTRVACGQLGYSEPQDFEAERNDGPFILNGLTCDGTESSMLSCNHTGFIQSQQPCRSNAAVWVRCKVFNRTVKFKNSANLKLRGAAYPWAGRVELKYKHTWTTLCDDEWNLEAANTVCRTLGYGTALQASRAAKYGQGTQLTIVEGIKCKGDEKNIEDCAWTVLEPRTNCTHFEDAGVHCNAPKYQLKEVRLVGGRNSSEGRVEVKIGGKWGTVCGDHWHVKSAMVVCRELGLNFAEKNITGREFGVGEGMVMSNPICMGDEISLTQCLRDESFTCSSPDNVAGVRCTDALPDLALSIRDIIRTLRVDYLPNQMLRCAWEENCLPSKANRYMDETYIRYYTRRLMRFSTVILNFGSADYRPLAKKEDWIWHSCHKHFHSQEEFATYDLLTADRARRKVAEGHKASFCLEDTSCLNGVDRKYNCTAGTQGISLNCFDDYSFSIDCQWIDVTEVRYLRPYIFHVNINPTLEVPETDFDNNVIVCDIYDRGSFIRVRDCGYDYCTSGLRSHGGNANRACCVFPFRFRGVWYNTCTKTSLDKYWCSTTTIFEDDYKWGLC